MTNAELKEAHELAQSLMRDTLHGAPPMKSIMLLAQAVVSLTQELALVKGLHTRAAKERDYERARNFGKKG